MKLKILFILLTCIMISGCNSFNINVNVEGKKLVIEKPENDFETYYYLQSQKAKELIEFKNDKNICIIESAIQNNSKTMIAFSIFVIPTRKFKNYFNNPLETKRFILLVSKDRIIYSREIKSLFEMKWISDRKLFIGTPNKKFYINEKGREM